MKKSIIIVAGCVLLLAGCNSVRAVEKEAVSAKSSASVKAKSVEKSMKEAVRATTQEAEDVVGIPVAKYKAFEKETQKRYADKGITDVFVAAYAKGIDLIFVTNKKNMSKEEFMSMARTSAKNFKKALSLSESLEIGVSLEYQADPTQNRETLYSVKVK